MTKLIVVGAYLLILVASGLLSARLFKGTSKDYFLASHSIGPFLLFMSIFGTTMTGFAMVGSTGKAFESGIGVFGLMASWSGLIHSAVFFLIGVRIWALGRKHGFVTQCQFFRDRFESDALGWILFVMLVLLIIPYILVGLLGSASTVGGLTVGMFPNAFPEPGGNLRPGSLPPWLTNGVVCLVVLIYIFFGGLRGATWANTFQTIVFLVVGAVAFILVARALGGLEAASQAVLERNPSRLIRGESIGHLQFLTYCFVPLSVGMFPHLFQHWLTARNAKAFRLTVVAHPICIMLLWVPCVLIGIWAAGTTLPIKNANTVLGIMVAQLHDPLLSGLITAGVLAAIMSSLDSQFLCLGTMFTTDVLVRLKGPNYYTDKQKLQWARSFIVVIVFISYLLSLFPPPHIFDLGVWCFTGYASLFPLVFAAIYWKRATRAGAIASALVVAVTLVSLFAHDMAARAGQIVAGDELLIMGMMPVTFIFLSGLATLILVSLCTRPPSQPTIDKYFPAAQRAS